MPSPADKHLDVQLRARLLARMPTVHASVAKDPIAFARQVTLVDPRGEMSQFMPDPWQAEALTCTGKLVLNCARQSGKSTTAAILAVHRAVTRPKALTLLISPSERQSGELLRKVVEVLRSIGAELTEENKSSLEFTNGSRIVSLPASEATIRGFSAVSLIVEDEAGDVPDELHVAVRPMLAISRGDYVMMGTPKGRRGHFFETWNDSTGAWRRIRVTAAECGRVDPTWLANEREDMGRRGLAELYRQEYEGEFVEGAHGRVYSGFDERRNVVDVLPAANQYAPWTYLLGLDFGIVDPNALSVLAWRKYDACVYVVRSYPLHGDVAEMADEVARLRQSYEFERTVGDTEGMGKAFESELRKRYIPITAAQKSDKVGHISLFNADLARGRIKLVRGGCQALVNEWRELVWAKDGKHEAEQSNHCADSCLYVWRAASAYLEQGYRDDRPEAGTQAWYEKIDGIHDAFAAAAEKEGGKDWVAAAASAAGYETLDAPNEMEMWRQMRRAARGSY